MATRYRILFLTERFPPQVGGVGISAERLARGLAARGHLVHIFHLQAGGDPGVVCSGREGELMVHRLGTLDAMDLTLQLAGNALAHLHDRVGFHIYHGHFATPAGYLAAFYARKHGGKSFVSARGNDVDRGMFAPEQFPFLRWTLEHADGIGCVSRELVEKCAVLSGREDIRYHPNSVDAVFYHPEPANAALREALGITDEAVLGFIGELRFKKGTHFLLEALRQVREKKPAKLLLVGGMRGEDRAYLRRYLRRFPDLRSDIHLVDYVHDREQLRAYYNLMDVVLSPSLWDGMPNSVLEAMACGRVVLASDVGGIRDVITHGQTGLLIGVHELARLGEGCLEILKAGTRFREVLGRRARKHVVAKHTPEDELDRLLISYALLSPNSPA
ncbi:MAG: glycosyltransferase family 4 protein [Armatimonadota bacterium]